MITVSIIALLILIGIIYSAASKPRQSPSPESSIPPVSVSTPASSRNNSEDISGYTVISRELSDDTWEYTVATDLSRNSRLEAIAKRIASTDDVSLKPTAQSNGYLMVVFFVPEGEKLDTVSKYKSYVWVPGSGWKWSVE
ncbi:MAG: hypothetical protein ACYDBB_04860 [Armatimonadota bacterium]